MKVLVKFCVRRGNENELKYDLDTLKEDIKIYNDSDFDYFKVFNLKGVILFNSIRELLGE